MNPTFGHRDILIWFFEIFFLMYWFWLLVRIATDLFQDDQVSGVSKVLWMVLVLVFPFIGVFAYLILRGGGMGARAARSAVEAQARLDAHIRSVAAETLSPADQIQRAKALLDAGAVNQAEFERLKAKALL